ncbi:hypothetical protein C1I95_25765 [Micromonospora craterilacus]|uniref:Uncharacterized protein n=1 Tax=Micromonospora craterilacus TaxID=1655439 RepID=A0A2W2EJM3_9ACTN|nr:hypothetical protein [Micromonospora craterilacus]PZG12458.1 hypothetical protein C1I95_25765 [Micromonospora craterilacus]
MTATTLRPAGMTPAGLTPAPTVSAGPGVVAHRPTCPYCLVRDMPGLLAGSCDSPDCRSAYLRDDARFERYDDQ